jgi:muramoyltetrapeptide carboxypeptidase LdcA involved in peptidoglycan recycling
MTRSTNPKRTLHPASGWKFLQGRGAEGHLIGGCFEVLDWLRGTPSGPNRQRGRTPSSSWILPKKLLTRNSRAWLAHLCGMDLEKLSGILFGGREERSTLRILSI